MVERAAGRRVLLREGAGDPSGPAAERRLFGPTLRARRRVAALAAPTRLASAGRRRLLCAQTRGASAGGEDAVA